MTASAILPNFPVRRITGQPPAIHLLLLITRIYVCRSIEVSPWGKDTLHDSVRAKTTVGIGELTVKLAKYYKVTKTNISEAITLTLLLRSVGAAMFGFAGDKWGRKWPMVANMIILGLLQNLQPVPGCSKFVRSLHGWSVSLPLFVTGSS